MTLSDDDSETNDTLRGKGFCDEPSLYRQTTLD